MRVRLASMAAKQQPVAEVDVPGPANEQADLAAASVSLREAEAGWALHARPGTGRGY